MITSTPRKMSLPSSMTMFARFFFLLPDFHFQPSSKSSLSGERAEVPSRHLDASLDILAFAAAMVESGEWELMDDDDGELHNITFV